MNSTTVRVVQFALASFVTVLLAAGSVATAQKAGPVTDDIGVITTARG